MDPKRIGSFTSSNIAALMTNGREKGTFGKPALTYIKQCNWERRLGRSLDIESDARPLSWGLLVEKRAFELLGLEYKLCSTETIQHPVLAYYLGSPDGQKFDEGGTVIDLKNPMTLTSFCELVHPLYNGLTGVDAINYIRENHKQGEDFFWQITSNAILTRSKYGELVVYCPYKSELEAIREMAGMIDDPAEQRKYYWIAQSDDDHLPWLPDGGYYKNLNVIRWEVNEGDKIALMERIQKGGKMLEKRQNGITHGN